MDPTSSVGYMSLVNDSRAAWGEMIDEVENGRSVSVLSVSV